MTEIESRPLLQDIPLPDRMRHLPRNKVGYVVPWFVARVDGEWDFRVLRADYFDAFRFSLCTLCGQPLGANVVFVTGPMCTISRTSGELPCHRDCGRYAVRACPFLRLPQMRRRETGIEEMGGVMSGIAIMRNPGVTAIWKPRRGTWEPFNDGRGGTLLYMGEPEEVEWWAHGRRATREEVETSIETGFPALMDMAEQEGERAVRELQKMLARALVWLPDLEPDKAVGSDV